MNVSNDFLQVTVCFIIYFDDLEVNVFGNYVKLKTQFLSK